LEQLARSVIEVINACPETEQPTVDSRNGLNKRARRALTGEGGVAPSPVVRHVPAVGVTSKSAAVMDSELAAADRIAAALRGCLVAPREP
jgi:hypothetical protein